MKKANIRNILVPIDFSKLSLQAVETAKRLARGFEARIHLAHVHPFAYPAGFMGPILSRGELPVSFEGHRRKDLAQQLERVAARFDLSAGDETHVRAGAPVFDVICSLAAEISADLIVTSTHGHTGLAHVFLGSTAERVVQHAPCPVLIVRNQGNRPGRAASKAKASGSIDTILVPVDFSQSSFQALEYAIEFAERVVAELIVFHAVNLGYAFTADGYGVADLSLLMEAGRKSAESQMQEFVGRAKFRRVRFETILKEGAPVPEICAVAEQRNADLIITATHGRTGLKHLLMGSVAEQVVRHARRAVLVVPSHPELRAVRSIDKTRRPQLSVGQRVRTPAGPGPTAGLTKRNRKREAHQFPERRRTNKFRESHSGSGGRK